jgi:hypothetical protein
MRAPLEVADTFRRCGAQCRQTHADTLGRAQRRVMSAIGDEPWNGREAGIRVALTLH